MSKGRLSDLLGEERVGEPGKFGLGLDVVGGDLARQGNSVGRPSKPTSESNNVNGMPFSSPPITP